MALVCEKGTWPLKCKAPVVEQCRYCGKHFCLTHGHQDKAICNSPECFKKYKADKEASDRAGWEEEQHIAGSQKNAAGLCGCVSCNSEFYIACGHCGIFYCSDHVTRHTFTFKNYSLRSITKVKGEITLCDICLPHLKDYKSDKYE